MKQYLIMAVIALAVVAVNNYIKIPFLSPSVKA